MQTRYGMFTARMECPKCGHPMPLNAPGRAASCSTCLNEISVPNEVWSELLENRFDTDFRNLAENQVYDGTFEVRGLRVRFQVAKKMPACEKCHAPLVVNQLAGHAQDFSCTSCGDPASTYPAPDWLRHLAPTAVQVYSTDPGEKKAGSVGLETASKPIVLACPSCGAALSITGKSERLHPCKYCEKEVYLPDEVWRRLHPVKTVMAFYVRFEGASTAQKNKAAEQSRREAQVAAASAQSLRAREAQEEQKRRSAEKRARKKAQAKDDRLFKEHAERAKGLSLKRQAWIAIAVAAVVVALGFVLALDQKGELPGVMFLRGLGPHGLMIGPGIVMLLAIIVAMGFANRPLKHGTKTDGDWIIFATWFWIPFAILPPFILIPLVAPLRFVILWRGKFGASTITTGGSSSGYGGSSRSYPKVRLEHGEGRPAAVVFLLIIALQGWVLIAAADTFPEIGQMFGFLRKMIQ